jgi:hypothetical protein
MRRGPVFCAEEPKTPSFDRLRVRFSTAASAFVLTLSLSKGEGGLQPVGV